MPDIVETLLPLLNNPNRTRRHVVTQLVHMGLVDSAKELKKPKYALNIIIIIIIIAYKTLLYLSSGTFLFKVYSCFPLLKEGYPDCTMDGGAGAGAGDVV